MSLRSNQFSQESCEYDFSNNNNNNNSNKKKEEKKRANGMGYLKVSDAWDSSCQNDLATVNL